MSCQIKVKIIKLNLKLLNLLFFVIFHMIIAYLFLKITSHYYFEIEINNLYKNDYKMVNDYTYFKFCRNKEIFH